MPRDNSDKQFLVVGMFWSGMILLTALLMFFSGCGKPPATGPVVLPPVFSADGTLSAGSFTFYEIPVEQVKENKLPETPGKDAGDLIANITVPPSTTETHVRVYDRPKPLKQKAKEAITGTGGSPDASVIADNPGVKAQGDKSTGLWPYIAGAFALIAGFILARKWLKRFTWVTRIIGKLKGVIGL